ncbi:S-adenosyl-L-methionine-dependent methyltransferase, partial [Sphaerosporella brunnea]
DETYRSVGQQTTTASLTDSVQHYVYENGRRYHSYYGVDKNLLPTDEIEQDRMDLYHEILLRQLDGRLHLAPIGQYPQRILDIGTGTGIWAIDMADRYPSAEVIGTDLSPIQPKWVPPNCKYEVDDAELEWTYAENSFDFIHARNLGQSIDDWHSMLQQAYRCLEPGGFIELAEIGGVSYSDDGSLTPDNPLNIFGQKLQEAMVVMGRPAHMTDTFLRDQLVGAGFVDVVVAARAKQPHAPWAREKHFKEIGSMVLLSNETGFDAYGLAAFTRILGMSKREAQGVCKDALTAVRNKNLHSYNIFYVVYGRKPEPDE